MHLNFEISTSCVKQYAYAEKKCGLGRRTYLKNLPQGYPKLFFLQMFESGRELQNKIILFFYSLPTSEFEKKYISK